MSDTPHELNISDLATIKNIIDLACERGAFRGSDMKVVGETYDKLTAFLAWVVEQANSQSQGDTNA